MLGGGGNRLTRLHAVLLLPSPPPRATAEGNDRFDELDEPGKPVAFPGPGADRAFLFAEFGIEHACLLGGRIEEPTPAKAGVGLSKRSVICILATASVRMGILPEPQR